MKEALAELSELAVRRPSHATSSPRSMPRFGAAARKSRQARVPARLAAVEEAERAQWERDNEHDLRRRRFRESADRSAAANGTEALDAAASRALDLCERLR